MEDLRGDHVSKDWQAVAAAVNTRLAERAMTQKALADASGVSVATLRKLQKAEPGDRGRPLLVAVSVALGWTPGHLEAVADGGASLDDPSADLRETVAAMRSDLDDVRSRLATLEEAQDSGH